MADSVLLIQQLGISFNSGPELIHAVENVSLDVKKGKTLAIVGESGSGKTLTALSIPGLLPRQAKISSGRVIFHDNNTATDLLSISNQELRKIRGNRISMIFQEPMTSLNPLKKVGVQVLEAILLHKTISKQEAIERVLALFEKVQLPDPRAIFHRYPHQLSGGQKQRIMIAMAVCCSPALLIADEPTTALDVTVQKAILALLKSLQDETGMSIIFITHDLGLVDEIADEVAVMYRGNIVEQGSVTQIFQQPEKAYTQALLLCRPAPEFKGQKLKLISDILHPTTADEKISVPAKLHLPDQQPNMPLLEVTNLSVRFPVKTNLLGTPISTFAAVDSVSFTINKGETVGLVGESGCGKTTLGRTLVRLIQPSSGHINFNGKDLASIPEDKMRLLRQSIQIIFQDPYGSLNPRITIGVAIAEPMKVHKMQSTERERRERVMDLLMKVDLKPEHYHRYPHEFSGGQRQRICIARALGLEPDFIIFDESVSALDVSVQAQILNLLNDLRRQLQFTCIFISHDLSVVYYISDRIMVMKNGKIEEVGSAEEIYYRPKSAYTQALIAAVPGRKFG